MVRFVPCIARLWLCHHFYGWQFAPSIANYQYPYAYVKALLFSAGAGTITAAEKSYIQGLVEVLTAESDPELLNFVENYDNQSLTPTSFISNTMLSPLLSKILVFDAIKVASANMGRQGQYTARQQQRLYTLGRQVGVPAALISRLEVVAKREVNVAARKRQLILSSEEQRPLWEPHSLEGRGATQREGTVPEPPAPDPLALAAALEAERVKERMAAQRSSNLAEDAAFEASHPESST